ncbi:MAG: hypothetical protein NUW37_06765, partial [Planctomycetes bacterium]|nr:hypothetical protein [Planctomycetota bacterium]
PALLTRTEVVEKGIRYVQENALIALGNMGKYAESALPILTQYTEFSESANFKAKAHSVQNSTPSETIRNAAREAIAKIEADLGSD